MLAVVIPYYKLSFFEATLKSLANQTNKRFKVYIGDDASPENPFTLLEKYNDKFNFVYHRFKSNLGTISLTQQWERCIKMTANEEWLMILGDDDVLEVNIVEEFYNNIEEVEQKGINVIRFASQKIGGKGKVTSKIYEHPKIEKAVQFLFDKTRSSLSEYVFRKSQVVKIRFKNFPLAWYSDVLAVLEFSNFTVIFSVNTAVVYVRISKLSISGSILNNQLKLQARFEFYCYLVSKKSNFFSIIELEELYYRLNKCYINNKKQYAFFLKISKIYLHKMLFKEYVFFIKQIVFTKKNRIV
ncbi:Glycosyl transferase family 2 [Flavobacterium flevense]|uniref:Glycosyl transferase n=1 Tax=Flavobacterium flevense TaxID=983 RepID=A0A4Y4AZD9_9FLAO|nr:glycosyltransferase family 2 protein [Flavobacterium flevense]GEC73665.1 glycosyl transferase [Flavobacterium flevense]SHL99847.1 Glycosyl transferase family 2 [Flavobacterium flevense]